MAESSVQRQFGLSRCGDTPSTDKLRRCRERSQAASPAAEARIALVWRVCRGRQICIARKKTGERMRIEISLMQLDRCAVTRLAAPTRRRPCRPRLCRPRPCRPKLCRPKLRRSRLCRPRPRRSTTDSYRSDSAPSAAECIRRQLPMLKSTT